MKVLVTGHKGYIGTVLVPMLLKAGHEVAGLDSDLFRRCTYGRLETHIPETIKDIRDAAPEDVRGFDAVIHLAGLSNDPLGNLDPQLTYEINHKASVNLALLAREAGVKRFLFSSTCSNYGAGGADWLTEESPFNPVSPYGISKVRAEEDLSKLADDTFSPVFLRNATAYGVSPRLRFDIVLNNLVAWAYTTGKVLLKSDGASWRPLIHVQDISQAFIAVLAAPKAAIHNEAFNVARKEDNFQIRQVASIVARIIPFSRVELSDDHFPDPRNYRVDASKISALVPEFKPRWNVIEGVRELYHSYRTSRITLEEFEGVKYQRIGHLKDLLEHGLINMNLMWTEQKASVTT